MEKMLLDTLAAEIVAEVRTDQFIAGALAWDCGPLVRIVDDRCRAHGLPDSADTVTSAVLAALTSK